MGVRTVCDLISEIDRLYIDYRERRIPRAVYLSNDLQLRKELEAMLRKFLSKMTVDDFLEFLYKNLLSLESVSNFTVGKVYRVVRKLIHERVETLLTDHMHFTVKRMGEEGIYTTLPPTEFVSEPEESQNDDL